MATDKTPFTRPINPNLVICYKCNGRYFVGQRILHPDFGLGTVIQVRRCKIHVVMDQDPDQPEGKKVRRFKSGYLTLQEMMEANNFNIDDLDTLFEIELEDFQEHFAICVFETATGESDDVV